MKIRSELFGFKSPPPTELITLAGRAALGCQALAKKKGFSDVEFLIYLYLVGFDDGAADEKKHMAERANLQ